MYCLSKALHLHFLLELSVLLLLLVESSNLLFLLLDKTTLLNVKLLVSLGQDLNLLFLSLVINELNHLLDLKQGC